MIRTYLSLLFGSLIILCSADLQSQELEKALQFDAQAFERSQLERSFDPKTQRGGGGLSIPFFDDFSTYSLPTDDPDIPAELQRWEESGARINANFPILPPTIGVATLDGMDGTGYPYNFNQPDAFGPADTLTSLPINLSGLSVVNNVYLTFFYESGGLGNAPDEDDLLVLEFLAPDGGEDAWIEVWSMEGTTVPMEEFVQVFVPVTEEYFFHEDFQFRFRNYATITGNLDHWHLDYVYLDANIDPENFEFFEIAFVYPMNTILQDFTAMPWTHFNVDPNQFMADSVTTLQRNLSGTLADNVTSGFKTEIDGDVADFLNPFSQVVVDPFEIFPTGYYVNDGDNQNYTFETENDTCAVFDVSFYEDNIGILYQEKIGVPNNDSIVYQQVFTNYYAYDDGSAERAYALNTAGGKVAVKYQLATEDTLLGLFIHFTPLQNNNFAETFLLRAWLNDGGVPGEEIGDNFQFQNPHYFTDGYDIFAFYEYDEPMPVDGTIFVGFVQDSNAELNIGLDKNTNSNPSKLYYQLGLGSDWQSSGIQGSVMIRPVLKSGKTNVWNSVEDFAIARIELYPNPTSGFVNVVFDQSWNKLLLEVVDMAGRQVRRDLLTSSNYQLDVSGIQAGTYIIRLRDPESQAIIAHEKLLIR